MIALAGLIIGSLGFLVSLSLGIIRIREYYSPLRLVLRPIEIKYIDDNFLSVLFEIDFLNPSSRGKIIKDIAFDVLGNKSRTRVVDPLREEDAEDDGFVLYKLPKTKAVFARLRVAETSRVPLDIPPNQSLSKLYLFLLNLDVQRVDTLPIQLHVTAYDADEKIIARHHEKYVLSKKGETFSLY